MALLQVHQAKALRDLHEVGHDLVVLHELRAATDLVLRATKVTAQSLGRAMSTLVVQERHLWLCLIDMKEQEKVQFLNAPVSQTGLFGDAVESCAQQFSAAQKQTEAIKHIMRRRKPAAASTPAAAPQPACRRGRPQGGSGSSLPLCGVVEPVTGRTPSPSRPPPNPAASASARGPETGDPEMEGTARREMVTAPLHPPEEGRVENPLFRFVFEPKTSIKEQFPQSLCLKRRRVVYHASRDHFPSPLSPGSGGLPKSTPPAHLWNRVRAVALKSPLQVVTRKPGSCVSPHTRRNQVSLTLHTQTPPPAIQARPSQAPGRVPVFHIPTGMSVTPLVPLARSLGAWLALPSSSRWLLRTIRLGYAIQFARRPPKFRGIRFTSVKAADAPVLRAEIAVLLAEDAIEPVPPADMGSGLFSPYFIVPKKGGGLRLILDLRVLNRALHKLPFKDVGAETHFCVRPSPKLVGKRST